MATDGEDVISMRPQWRFKADDALALVAAALTGIGLSGFPDELINGHLAPGALVPVVTGYPLPGHGICVIRPPGPQLAY